MRNTAPDRPELAISVLREPISSPRSKRLVNHLRAYRLHASRPLHVAPSRSSAHRFAIIEDELEAINKRLSQLPTRNEVWRAAMLGMLSGAVAAVTLIEAFARACP